MHEVGIARGIVVTVEVAAQREHFSRAARLSVEVGCLAGVDPAALRFALRAMAPGTCLEGAEILIEERAGTAWCRHCARVVTIRQQGEPCPDCGAFALRVTGGAGLVVRDLIVYTDDTDPPGAADHLDTAAGTPQEQTSCA